MDLNLRKHIAPPQQQREQKMPNVPATTKPTFQKYHVSHQPNPKPMRTAESIHITSDQLKNSGKQRLAKYSRKASSPSEQYKKLKLDVDNVFYENRKEVKDMVFYHKAKKVLLLVWLVLAISWFFINRIVPFSGKCPQNADCMVFIHCHYGFQLNNEQKCVIKQELIEQVEQLCANKIEMLKYEYGDEDCRDNPSHSTPSLQFQAIFEQFSLQNQNILKGRIENFLEDKDRQSQLKFFVRNTHGIRRVYPAEKNHQFLCQLQLSLQQPSIMIAFGVALLVIGIVLYISHLLGNAKKGLRIYNYLKEKVKVSHTININRTREQLELSFGTIDESTWETVNELRVKEKQIEMFEDESLHWRLIS